MNAATIATGIGTGAVLGFPIGGPAGSLVGALLGAAGAALAGGPSQFAALTDDDVVLLLCAALHPSRALKPGGAEALAAAAAKVTGAIDPVALAADATKRGLEGQIGSCDVFAPDEEPADEETPVLDVLGPGGMIFKKNADDAREEVRLKKIDAAERQQAEVAATARRQRLALLARDEEKARAEENERIAAENARKAAEAAERRKKLAEDEAARQAAWERQQAAKVAAEAQREADAQAARDKTLAEERRKNLAKFKTPVRNPDSTGPEDEFMGLSGMQVVRRRPAGFGCMGGFCGIPDDYARAIALMGNEELLGNLSAIRSGFDAYRERTDPESRAYGSLSMAERLRIVTAEARRRGLVSSAPSASAPSASAFPWKWAAVAGVAAVVLGGGAALYLKRRKAA